MDLTIEEAAAEIAEYMEAIHAAYPNVKIGMNEPIPWYWWESYAEHLGRAAPDLKECIDALLAAVEAAGEKERAKEALRRFIEEWEGEPSYREGAEKRLGELEGKVP